MKKIILIGASQAGKSTLAQALLDKEIDCSKTQSLEYKDFIIDTPGEYVERRSFYNALIASSVDADVIGLVVDPTASQFYLPPNFSTAFNKEVIGIITKADLKQADISRAAEVLKAAGVTEIVITSSYDGNGIEELKKILFD